MRESQYQIPVTEVLQDGGEAQSPNNQIHQHRMEAEFFARKNEVASAPEVMNTAHRKLREIGSHLDWYRNEAVRTPVARKDSFGSRILGLVGVERKALPSLNTLIDEESLAGGSLFKVSARFWFHPPASADTQVRDWYFTFAQDDAEYTLHYQTDGAEVHKIYNGRKHPFTEGEAERLVEAAEAYEQRVVRDVYGREPVTFGRK